MIAPRRPCVPGKGHSVVVDCVIKEEALREVLRVTAREIVHLQVRVDDSYCLVCQQNVL